MNKYECEMVLNNKCLGCVGLYERDWVGKYKCTIYQELKKGKINDNKNSFIGSTKEKSSANSNK